MKQNKFTLTVFNDMPKAFDNVYHGIMLKKLEFYGITGDSVKWFESYHSKQKS